MRSADAGIQPGNDAGVGWGFDCSRGGTAEFVRMKGQVCVSLCHWVDISSAIVLDGPVDILFDDGWTYLCYVDKQRRSWYYITFVQVNRQFIQQRVFHFEDGYISCLPCIVDG